MLARWGLPLRDGGSFPFPPHPDRPLARDRPLPFGRNILRARLPPLPAPFIVDEVALVGERADGRFDLLHRYALTG